jgi:hypothetical protein
MSVNIKGMASWIAFWIFVPDSPRRRAVFVLTSAEKAEWTDSINEPDMMVVSDKKTITMPCRNRPQYVATDGR